MARAKSFDEAVGMVNAHEYGNGTAIFTRDGDAARTFANAVNIGMVGVNIPIPVPPRSTASAAGSAPCSATTTRTGWRACASTPARRARRAGRPASGRGLRHAADVGGPGVHSRAAAPAAQLRARAVVRPRRRSAGGVPRCASTT